MDELYRELINSERVLPTTRKVLLQRLEENSESSPKAIGQDVYPILRAVLARLIPQTSRERPIDIAARLDLQHSEGKGNGWRYADMPPDKDALELGLRLLEEGACRKYNKGFAELAPELQDRLLTEVQGGEVRWPDLNAKRWFEEILSDATVIFVSHPETLAQIGFSGIAIQPGWKNVGLNEGEPWEPVAR